MDKPILVESEEEVIKGKETIYISKQHFSLIKKGKNHYEIKTVIENKHFFLDKMIDFPFIECMYQINSHQFENIHLQVINDKEAHLYVLVKHLFKEFGAFQRFISLKLHKFVSADHSITFTGFTTQPDCNSHTNIGNATIAPIEKIEITIHIINPHKIQMIQHIQLEKSFPMNYVLEKLFIQLVKTNMLNVVQALQSLH